MKKLMISAAILAATAPLGLASDHTQPAYELRQLVEQHGPTSAFVAGIVMGETLAPQAKAELLSRLRGQDSYDICNWCGCCAVKNDGIEISPNPYPMNFLNEVLE